MTRLQTQTIANLRVRSYYLVIMANASRITAYERGLFRVEEQPIDDRQEPYIFVKRVGAVTILPVIEGESGPQILTIDNNRRHYGMSAKSLPSGNVDGGHDNPDSAEDTTWRELAEEVGYAPRDPKRPNIDIFRLRTVSNTIDYPRFFAVVRDVEYLATEQESPAEIISASPTPLEEYADELLRLSNGRLYPEVNAAFAKAGMECGRTAVLGWLHGDLTVPSAADVPQSFEPWLLRANS